MEYYNISIYSRMDGGLTMAKTYTQKWLALVDKRVYLSIGAGDLTAEDMRNFDHEFLGMIESSSTPLVHLIADSRQVLSLPSLGEMRKNRYPYHPRMGYNITVGAFHDPVMRFVLSVSTAISQVYIFFILKLLAALIP